MTESQIQKQIIDYLKTIGAIVIRHNAGRVKNNLKLSPDGFPDLQAILRGARVVFIEVKTESGTLRPSQRKMHSYLQERGQEVIVSRSLDDVIAYLHKNNT